MPFILILLGLILFVTAIKGTTGQLGTLLGQDLFTGSTPGILPQGQQASTTTKGGYVWWLAAIITIGAVGYIKPLKGLSDAFIVLLLIVLVVHDRGFFANFTAALNELGNPQGTQGFGSVLANVAQTQATNPTATAATSGGASTVLPIAGQIADTNPITSDNATVIYTPGPAGSGYLDSGTWSNGLV